MAPVRLRLPDSDGAQVIGAEEQLPVEVELHARDEVVVAHELVLEPIG
jgi:hypothetical protein